MGPTVDIATARPAPCLAPFVERYVGYRLEGFPAGRHRGLPSRHLTFIVSIGRPVRIVGMPGRGPLDVAMDAFVSGLAVGPAMIEHDGNEAGVAVDLRPLGARALFGLPGRELAGELVELPDLMGRATRSLPDRLAEAPTWASRFQVMDGVLAAAVQRGERRAGPAAEVQQAWQRLVGAERAPSPGEADRPGVDALAAAVGWSRRHLTEQFHREVGLPPRQLQRVLRFEQARAALAAGRHSTLADVAAHAGYFDHAHMTRDWHDLAGCSPSTWLAEEELPSVQDNAPDEGAG
jgi:AraC-like DNA-binding protein